MTGRVSKTFLALTLVYLLACAPLFAAVEFDAHSNAPSNDIIASTAWNHTVTASGANRVLIVGIVFRSDVTDVACTCATVSMTKIVQYPDGTTNPQGEVSVFQLANPATGTVEIACSWTNISRHVAHAVSLLNVDQTTPIRDFKTAALTTGSPGTELSVTPDTVAGDLVVDIIGVRQTSSAHAPDDGQTQRGSVITNSNISGGMSTKPAVGSTTTVGWTWTTNAPARYVGVAVQAAGTARRPISPMFLD